MEGNRSGYIKLVSMELFRASLDRSAEKGDIQILAQIYDMARQAPTTINGEDVDARSVIEAALNKALENLEDGKKVVTDVENNAIYDFLMRYDLPKSTQIKAVQIMAKQGLSVFAIAKLMSEEKFSGDVKAVCEDALIEFTKIPEKTWSVASVYVETIANLRKRPLGERVEKACDDSMIKAVEAWSGEGNIDAIKDLIEDHGWLSDAVKAAAAKELGKWENLGESDFISDLEVVASCCQTCWLLPVAEKAPSPRTKELAESAIVKAMDNAFFYGWNRATPDSGPAAYSWAFAQELKDVLKSGCSNGVKKTAKKLLEKWGEEQSQLPEGVSEGKKVREDFDRFKLAIKRIDAYILQERKRLGIPDDKGMLSQGTVPAPKSGGNGPAQEKIPARR